MYAIIGATGNTGKVISEKLLAHGEKVRVIGRDAKRLEGLARRRLLRTLSMPRRWHGRLAAQRPSI